MPRSFQHLLGELLNARIFVLRRQLIAGRVLLPATSVVGNGDPRSGHPPALIRLANASAKRVTQEFRLLLEVARRLVIATDDPEKLLCR